MPSWLLVIMAIVGARAWFIWGDQAPTFEFDVDPVSISAVINVTAPPGGYGSQHAFVQHFEGNPTKRLRDTTYLCFIGNYTLRDQLQSADIACMQFVLPLSSDDDQELLSCGSFAHCKEGHGCTGQGQSQHRYQGFSLGKWRIDPPTGSIRFSEKSLY